MDLVNITRSVDKLAEADAVIADSYLRCLLDKLALYATAALIGIVALAALELSVFWLLERSIDSVAAAALIAAANGILAGVVFILALRLRPGPQFSIALDMRRSAIQDLEQQLSPATSGSPGYLLRPAIDTLLSSVVVPSLMIWAGNLKEARASKARPPESGSAVASDHI